MSGKPKKAVDGLADTVAVVLEELRWDAMEHTKIFTDAEWPSVMAEYAERIRQCLG